MKKDISIRAPLGLAMFDNYVVYVRQRDNAGNVKTVLINPKTGREANINDATTWEDINVTRKMAEKLSEREGNEYIDYGVAFMFGEPGKPSGVAGINLENCFNDDGTLKDYAAEIVKLMNSYTEYSITGHGLNILFTLSKSLQEFDSSFDKFKRNSELRITICDSGGYVLVTNKIYGERVLVDERTEQARQVIAKYFTQTAPAKTQEQESQSENQTQESSEFNVKEAISNAEYLDSVFEADIRDFQKYSQRKTGFANLDGEKDSQKIMILYPGLYVIGAVSSGGKTTLCLQLADNLATMGEHVLFFAFEQRRFELVSKSLARLCQPEGKFYDSAPTAIEIRKGRITPELREAMQKYRAISQNSRIVECDFKTDINRIIDTVEDYIKRTGVKPVVFVDYLQLITSNDPKLKNKNTKDIVDANVRALKLLQMKHGLIMFVVSSINRENYATSIDFSSFKETGGIEFTADVVLGLQSYIIHDKLFDGVEKTNINIKREALRLAKTANPRAIELCILKNRYGLANMSFYFQYYAKFDLFIPSDLQAMEAASEIIVKQAKNGGNKKSNMPSI